MKLKEVKNRIAENKEEIKSYAVIGGVLAIYVGVCVVAIKQQKTHQAQVEAHRKKLVDAINRGSTILPNTDGSFWILDPTG